MSWDMIDQLQKAYAEPTQKFCFYSANGAETASKRLNGMARWDWTPAVVHGARGNSTCVLPLTLGCPPIRTVDGNVWVQPCIRHPRDVAKVHVPSPQSGATGRILADVHRLARDLASGQYIRCPDIQSPLGVAELMWDESFYIALIESPEAVHELLDRITGFMIRYIRAIQDAGGAAYNPCGFPLIWASGSGTMLSDDTMTLVSPEMHAEFSVPYLNRIADAVGPIYYHSCSWHGPYFDNIRRLHNVRALNWNVGNSADPVEIIRAFSGQAVLALHLAAGMHDTDDVRAWGGHFADEAEFFDYCLDAMLDDTCMYWWLSDVCAKGDVLERIYDSLALRGYAPRSA